MQVLLLNRDMTFQEIFSPKSFENKKINVAAD